MSQSNYAVSIYGIMLRPGTTDFKKTVEKLAAKHNELYEEAEQDAKVFLTELEETGKLSIVYQRDIEDLSLYNLNEDCEEFWSEEVLIFAGDHNFPKLYSSPFNSKQEVIDFYKEQFGEFLPENFSYEENLGKISYVIWG